jgi:hypothetical protein
MFAYSSCWLVLYILIGQCLRSLVFNGLNIVAFIHAYDMVLLIIRLFHGHDGCYFWSLLCDSVSAK